MDNQRNLLLAVALSGLLILGWDFAMRYFYPEASIAGADPVEEVVAEAAPGAPVAAPGDIADSAAPSGPVDLDTALASDDRVRINAPRVEGSINLVGARIDDIELIDHRESVEDDAGPVQLFAPQGTQGQYFAQFGWIGQGVALPDAQTVWTSDSETLAPGAPVTMSWDNGEGQTFQIRIAIDENYMLTADQSVTNNGTGPVVVQAYGLLNRNSAYASPDQWIVHAGPMGAFSDAVEYGPDYDDLLEEGAYTPEGSPEWLGFSDIYWLGALIPRGDAQVTPGFRSLGENVFRADMIYAPVTVPAGGTAEQSSLLFAGAKESAVLDTYRDQLGIARFGKAVDWGWFEWFVKPMVWLLRTLYDFVGNFGVAIILLTVIIRALLFPIACSQSGTAGRE